MKQEIQEEKDTLPPLQELRIDQLRRDGFPAYAIQKNKGVIY